MTEFAMPVGLYEKALPADLSWEERLRTAAEAGYDFVDISIDETDCRLARLDWSASERAALRQAIANTGVPILTMCLSAHRKYPLSRETLGYVLFKSWGTMSSTNPVMTTRKCSSHKSCNRVCAGQVRRE